MATLTPPCLLFITSSRIGDAVLSSGVLALLLEQYPDARVTVACGPVAAPLFADLPGLEQLHVIERRPRLGHWRALWRAMHGRRWQVVADLRGSLLAWTLSTEHRLICRAEKRHEHRIEELARQLRLPRLPAPLIWLSEDRRRCAAQRLGDGPPVLAVGPTANWAAKQWPIERFRDAVAALTAADGIFPGARVAVFGAAAERPLAAPLLAAIPTERRLDFIGLPDLLDCQAVLERCSFYFGNDSGLMHMAAAAGIPTLGLFGPSPEWRYGPYGRQTAVVRTPESFEQLVVDNPAFDHRKTDCLMTGLSVEAVVGTARTLWQEHVPPGR